MLFSKRNNIVENAEIINDVTESFKNRLLNSFNYLFKISLTPFTSVRILNQLWDQLGYKIDMYLYDLQNDDVNEIKNDFLKDFNHKWEQLEWYRYFDIIEFIIKFNVEEKNKIEEFKKEINKILSEENIGYRIID